MALKVNGTTVKKLVVNGTTVKRAVANGVTVFKAEKIISDSSTNLWGAVIQTGGSSYYSNPSNLTYHIWSKSINVSEGAGFKNANTVSTDGYSTLYITFKYRISSYYGTSGDVGGIDIYINGTTIHSTGNLKYTYIKSKNTGGYVTKTISYDVSKLSSLTISTYCRTTCVGAGTEVTLNITKSWLE